MRTSCSSTRDLRTMTHSYILLTVLFYPLLFFMPLGVLLWSLPGSRANFLFLISGLALSESDATLTVLLCRIFALTFCTLPIALVISYILPP